MTIERLAEMVNGGFERTTRDMAGVGQELAALMVEARVNTQSLHSEIDIVRQELKGDIAALRSEISSEFADLRRAHNYGPELDEIRERVKELEKKVGVRR